MKDAVYLGDSNTGPVPLDPSFPRAPGLTVSAYEQKGMYPQAIAEFQKGVKLSGSPLILALLGHAYAASRKTVEARQVLSELQDLSESQAAETRRYVSPYTVAAIYTGLGEKSRPSNGWSGLTKSAMSG